MRHACTTYCTEDHQAAAAQELWESVTDMDEGDLIDFALDHGISLGIDFDKLREKIFEYKETL